MSKATDKSLGELHGLMAEHFKELLTKGVPYEDAEGNIKYKKATASDLNVIRQFLKDNGIDASPAVGSPLHSLATVLPFPTASEASGIPEEYLDEATG